MKRVLGDLAIVFLLLAVIIMTLFYMLETVVPFRNNL
jgi:hypothetical protein